MWNTTQGERVLRGAEAVVFRSTVAELIDAIRAERELDVAINFTIPVFDNLQWQQKLAMLWQVAAPLLTPSTPEPKPSAIRDATVGAVFAQMLNGVQTEIECQQFSAASYDDDANRRVEVAAALNELMPDDNWPDAECVVVESWELGIDVLQNRVLFDEDWQFDSMTLDIPPDHADELRAGMGIDRDYFCAIPPDVDERPPEVVWADIFELVTGTRPDESVFVASAW